MFMSNPIVKLSFESFKSKVNLYGKTVKAEKITFENENGRYTAIIKGDFPTVKIMGRPSTNSVFVLIGYGKNKKAFYIQ